jgi:hypothetical protein
MRIAINCYDNLLEASGLEGAGIRVFSFNLDALFTIGSAPGIKSGGPAARSARKAR